MLQTSQDVYKRQAQTCAVHEGTTQEVLVEAVSEHDPGMVTGRLSNNLLVHFPGGEELIGQYVDCLLYTSRCV